MLQGSLENFTIPEILGLLAITTKTGRLKVSGDRGTGSVWCRDGLLELAEASKLESDAGIDDVMLELLRYGSGNFSFQADEVLPEGAVAEGATVESVLVGASTRLEEWHSIEAVVPSLEHSLTPVSELPGSEVTIKSDEWEFLIAIGDSRTVGEVGTRVGLGEIDVSRRAKGLIERELVEIGSHPGRRTADIAPSAQPAPIVEPVEAIDEAPVAEPAPVVDAPIAEETIDEAFVAEEFSNEATLVVEEAPVVRAPSIAEPIAETAPVFDASTLEVEPVSAVDSPSFESSSFESSSFDEAASFDSASTDSSVDADESPAIEDMLASIAVNQSVENRASSEPSDLSAPAAPMEAGETAFAIDSGLAPSFDDPVSFAPLEPGAEDGVEYTDFARSAIGDAPFEPAEPLPATDDKPSIAADMGEIESLRETMLTDDDDEADSSVLMQFLNTDR